MEKFMADKVALNIANSILKNDCSGIIPEKIYGEDAAEFVANFIESLSTRLQSDLTKFSSYPLNDH